MSGLPEIEAVERLRLEPGDVVVVRVSDRHLTHAEAQGIKDQVTEALGHWPVLVLPPGLDLEVVSAQEEDQGEPRCQHVSPSPWGPTQCALPLDHEERHAYSPSETIGDLRETRVTP